jgi:hypothetical protein
MSISRKVVKTGANLIGAVAGGSVVSALLKSAKPSTGIVGTIAWGVGAWALSCAAGLKAGEFTEEFVDSVYETQDAIKESTVNIDIKIEPKESEA